MSFKVHIEPSAHEFRMQDGETILAAALREGLRLPYSCRDGRCGSCKGTVLSGRVDYGDYEAKALSSEEKAQGKALFCQAVPLEDVVIQAREIEVARDIAIKILPCRVVKMEKLTHDVMALYLKLPQNERLQFLAGQYIDILLRDGRRRSFSLANAPHDDGFLQIHVRHVPGGHFSHHVFTEMQEKALLRFEGPLGTFFLREGGSTNPAPGILMAGGTGFAPIKAILEHAFYTGVTRPLHLFWGARARRDLYLHELALSWERSYPNFRYTPVLSEPLPSDQWPGEVGWVHEAVVRQCPDLGRYEIYAGGPPPMIEAGKAAFIQHRLLPENLYFDSFEFAKDPSKNRAR